MFHVWDLRDADAPNTFITCGFSPHFCNMILNVKSLCFSKLEHVPDYTQTMFRIQNFTKNQLPLSANLPALEPRLEQKRHLGHQRVPHNLEMIWNDPPKSGDHWGKPFTWDLLGGQKTRKTDCWSWGPMKSWLKDRILKKEFFNL